MKSVTIKHKGVVIIKVIRHKNGVIEAIKGEAAHDAEIEVRDEKGFLVRL